MRSLLKEIAPITFLALLLSTCGPEERSKDSAPEQRMRVRIITVQPVQESGAELVPGNVRAKLRASIEAKIAGRIEKMPVSEGQPVAEGQLLAQLDAQEIRAKLDQAVALKEQAERDLARFSVLLQQKAATQVEFDGMQVKARVARAAVEEARTMLGYAEMRAPFSGVITKKNANVGDLASPGRPILDMEDPERLRFEADVPETLIKNVSLGMSLKIHIPARDVYIDGVVVEIAPVADPNSRTYMVKLDLPSNEGLNSGQFGHVSVRTSATTSIMVPAAAVMRRGQMELVFVAKEDKAWLRLVRTGKTLGADKEVLSGLEPGDAVVVDPGRILKDGASVEILQ